MAEEIAFVSDPSNISRLEKKWKMMMVFGPSESMIYWGGKAVLTRCTYDSLFLGISGKYGTAGVHS
jgi:hypothetical protein